MRKWTVFLIAASLALTFAGCSEKDRNPVGFGLVEEDDHWQTNQTVIQEVLADSCISVSTGAGSGFYLMVGSWEGLEARSLLLFEELPDTLSWPLTAAKLILTSYTEANEESLHISVHSIQSEWDDSTVTWTNPWTEAGGDFDPELIAQGTHAIILASELELDFEAAGVELVQGWLEGQTNNGILLKAVDLSENNLKYFYTTDTPFDPQLQLTFATSDTTDTTVTVDPDEDASIVQPGEPVGEGFLCVSDGFVRRSWIHFNLSTVPESAFVNRATLSLAISEFSDPLDEMTIGAYMVTDLQTFEFSFDASSSADLSSAKDMLEIELTDLVQNWSYGTENAGLILKALWEYSDLSWALFFNSTADSLHRPTLTVLYTVPPKGILNKHTRGGQIP